MDAPCREIAAKTDEQMTELVRQRRTGKGRPIWTSDEKALQTEHTIGRIPTSFDAPWRWKTVLGLG